MLDKRKIIIALIGLLTLLGGFLIFKYGFKKDVNPEKVTIVVWGLFDDSGKFRNIIELFNADYSYITIEYYKKDPTTFENELIDALATGRGPDVFLIHNTWLPKHKEKLLPLAKEIAGLKDFQETFVDVAYQDFIDEAGNIYSLPVWCDTMALFWNKDYFNREGITRAPVSWEEFSEDVVKLTLKDENGNLLRSGAAIGAARNINRSTDLLSLLMLQTGTKMVNQAGLISFDSTVNYQGQSYTSGEEALRFYTDFANPQKSVYTWNRQQDYSIDAFIEGEAAMIFNYAYNLPLIEARAPHLNFAVAPMPQTKNTQKDVNYANYWSYAVSRTSQQPAAAQNFVWWLAQEKNARAYLEYFNRPAARRDLIEEQKNDATLGVFSRQALTAQSWPQPDNLAVEQIFADMIEEVVLGQATVKDALLRAASRVKLIAR